MTKWVTINSLLHRYLLFMVLAVYACGLIAMFSSVGVGVISWGLWQFLDPAVLRAFPLSSLWLLHAQPPLQNTLLAGALVIEDTLGWSAQSVISAVMAVVGGVALWCIHRIGRQLSLAPWVMAFIFAGVIVNSHFWSGVKNFSYELLLVPMALGIVLHGIRYWQNGTFYSLIMALVLASLMTLTRTTFHPVWCAVVALMMMGLRAMRASFGVLITEWPWRRVMVLLILMASGWLWPAKNAVVFGDWVHSSWDGFNVSRGYVSLPPALDRFLGAGEVHIQIEEWNPSFDPAQHAAASQVTSITRSNGVENWNHYLLLATRKALIEAALAERLKHPDKWFLNAVNNYLMWSTPSYVDPYSDTPLARDDYGRVKWLYDTVLYNDLRPWLAGASLVGETSEPTLPYARYTLMALLYIPSFMLFALIIGMRGVWVNNTAGPALLMLLFIYSWPMVISMLTDGQESTRFRIAVEPLFWLGWGLILNTLFYARKGNALA